MIGSFSVPMLISMSAGSVRIAATTAHAHHARWTGTRLAFSFAQYLASRGWRRRG